MSQLEPLAGSACTSVGQGVLNPHLTGWFLLRYKAANCSPLLVTRCLLSHSKIPCLTSLACSVGKAQALHEVARYVMD
jgi:hypothetical protein